MIFMVQELFFDKIVRYYRVFKSTGDTRADINNAAHSAQLDIMGIRDVSEVSVFLVNGATADDLAYCNSFPALEDFRMPFSHVFFEFLDPIHLGYDGKTDLYTKGLLLSTTNVELVEEPGVYAVNIYTSDKLGIEFHGAIPVMFNLAEYVTNPDIDSDVIDVSGENISDDIKTVISESSRRFTGLSINLVYYINAHNVTIRTTNRETRSSKNLARINRDRLKHRKNPIFPLPPYHWIEIKQHVVDERRSGEEGSMDYRERVRGHFQRYHTGQGVVRNWIEPYIRGPEGAPWKEARYKVLDDMLRRGSRYS